MRRSAQPRRMAVGLVLLATALAAPTAVLASGHAPGRIHHRGLCPPHVKRHKGKCPVRATRRHGSPAALAKRAATVAIADAERYLRAVPRSAYGHVPAPLRHGLPSLVTNHGATAVMSRLIALADARATHPAARARDAAGDAPTRAHAADAPLAGWDTHVQGSSSDDPDRIGIQDVQATATATKEALVDGLHVKGELSPRASPSPRRQMPGRRRHGSG